MALSLDETTTLTALARESLRLSNTDALMDAYYEGQQRLEHIGLAVPPELRRFETVVNWPSLVVDSVTERIRLKSLMLPGQDLADPGLQEGWDANNLDSEQHLLWNDKCVYGRAFLCLGTNDEDPEHPLITVESPLEVTVSIDPRTRRVRAALRLYGQTEDDPTPSLATLYLPDVTVWLERVEGRWRETLRDEHRLGRVPVVPFFNRRRTGRWTGVSEMARAISLTDAAARSLTNLQIAGETHSVPQKWVLGMSKGDFVDADGNPIPAWQSYFSAIWANQNKDAKVGQFTASDLKNFHETVNFYGGLLAGVYGLPIRYMGQLTANPPSADGIRADEARTVLRAERHMAADGDQLGRAFAIYLRLRDGEWITNGDRIKAEWHDAATPTYAAKVDGIQKLTGGAPILSIEGGWDELGWSETRKQRERDYFQREATTDPILNAARQLQGGSGAPAGGQ
ncbi:MAG: phage portal protein [Motilibacteraceae bacterium]